MTEYILGANYWASNAGAEMWRNFDASCIQKDLKALYENGIEYVRVFPNWRDFQPVMALYGASNCFCEYRMGNAELPKNPYYLDEIMLERFDQFCSLCEAIGIKVIPSLLTGWMSGRMFLPPALDGKNLFSDAEALNFEQKFIEGFVKRFRDKAVIVAWDVGNECSCLTYADNHDRAEFWTAFISNTIRSADNTRPIISGIHDMKPQGRWRIQDQGKYCDILVAHPYPYWGKHTNNDRITSIRTLLHATAIHNLYRDIGGKPCFVNEIGTMGPMVCNDEVSAGFAKANLYACMAHGSVGFMWWCAHEQTNLTTAPYSWNMCETELGLLDTNRQPKPILREIKAFADWKKTCNLKLSRPQVDAICILTRDQDQWGIAYMTYILAVMAGLNIGFCYADDPLPQANTYLMPSVTGHWVMPGERYAELRERVRQGATLYISNSNAILSEFNALAGVRVVDSAQVSERSEMLLDGEKITFSRSKKYDIVPKDTKNVIAYETNGDPVLVRNGYGDGQVLYLNFPLEEMLLHGSERFAENHHLVYKTLFRDLIAQHCVSSDVPHLGITHHFDGEKTTVVIINYSPNTCNPNLRVHEDYEICSIIKGGVDEIEPFSTTILQVTKK